MTKTILILTYVLLLTAPCSRMACGGGADDPPPSVVYDPAGNVITAANFTDQAPCTLKALLAADRAHGWNVIQQRAADDVYTCNATLLIGENDRGSTCFQIGTETAPRETLVMRGGLYIIPPYVRNVNDNLKSAGALRKLNRPVPYNSLVLGVAGNTNITPALKFEAGPAGAVGRFCAGVLYPGKLTGYQARLAVYNGVIAPAETAPAASIDSELYCGLIAVNSRLSGFRKSFFFGARGDWTSVSNCIFENSGLGVINTTAPLLVKNSVFRNCDVAFGDWGGPMNLTLDGCVLENNRRNWRVQRGSVSLLDCVVGPAAGEDELLSRDQSGPLPEIIVRRRLSVQVVNQAGKPVPNADVMLIPEQPDPALLPGRAATGPDGFTPAAGDLHALVALDYRLQASKLHRQPERTDYSYEIIVAAPGYPEQSWPGVRFSQNGMVIKIVLDGKTDQ